MTSITRTAGTASLPVPLPAPGRSGGDLAVLALPLWLACFALLYFSQGTKPSETLPTAELQAKYLESGPAIWLFAVLSIAAALLLALAPIVLAWAARGVTSRRGLSTSTILVAGLGGLVGLSNTVGFAVFLAAPAQSIPAWAVPDGRGDVILNAVTWALLSLGVALAAATLWRAAVLPRLGLVIAVLAVLVLALGPIPTAVLLAVLGIPLLRRAK